MATTNQIRHESTRRNDDEGFFPMAAMGGPDGDLVMAPDARDDMIRLQQAARKAGKNFYCPPSLDGCGEELVAAAGDIRRPYFRHFPGSSCGFRGEDRDIFTHRQIQRELVRWLTGQGFTAEAERYVGREKRSRVDVSVGGGMEWVIEVQLSNETAVSKLDRTERYGGNVTWLFGADRFIASRDHEMSEHGVTQLVRLAARPTGQEWSRLETAATWPIEIGLRAESPAGQLPKDSWFPLTACTFDLAHGLMAPGLLQAKQEVMNNRRAAAEEKARKQAELAQRERLLDALRRKAAEEQDRQWANDQAARRENEPRVPVDELRRRTLAALAREDMPRMSTTGKVVNLNAWHQFACVRKTAAPAPPLPATPLPGPRPTVLTPRDLQDWTARTGRPVTPEGTWWTALVLHAASYEWWTSQIDGRWVEQLRPDLVDPAWVALYLSTIEPSGSVRKLAEETADPAGLAMRRLHDLGLITITVRSGGQWTYRTRHNLRNVGRAGDWNQPHPWPLS
ncbi:competence protein CoiA family protein [Raineyella fluvialis]|uniref:Competence protein CoiA nuclease-like domain-containing protein n=1 Tax=Raineyella fluvialis TaxID=2662261 RepID=A0A5Q2FBJ9_9ACTN|nr:competence protein CoiA family protein [Raineyella fluvialis]QGF23781.1 hypothetical protein Rai3103_08955 [Raineyella fluvialis]